MTVNIRSPETRRAQSALISYISDFIKEIKKRQSLFAIELFSTIFQTCTTVTVCLNFWQLGNTCRKVNAVMELPLFELSIGEANMHAPPDMEAAADKAIKDLGIITRFLDRMNEFETYRSDPDLLRIDREIHGISGWCSIGNIASKIIAAEKNDAMIFDSLPPPLPLERAGTKRGIEHLQGATPFEELCKKRKSE